MRHKSINKASNSKKTTRFKLLIRTLASSSDSLEDPQVTGNILFVGREALFPYDVEEAFPPSMQLEVEEIGRAHV